MKFQTYEDYLKFLENETLTYEDFEPYPNLKVLENETFDKVCEFEIAKPNPTKPLRDEFSSLRNWTNENLHLAFLTMRALDIEALDKAEGIEISRFYAWLNAERQKGVLEFSRNFEIDFSQMKTPLNQLRSHIEKRRTRVKAIKGLFDIDENEYRGTCLSDKKRFASIKIFNRY